MFLSEQKPGIRAFSKDSWRAESNASVGSQRTQAGPELETDRSGVSTEKSPSSHAVSSQGSCAVSDGLTHSRTDGLTD